MHYMTAHSHTCMALIHFFSFMLPGNREVTHQTGSDLKPPVFSLYVMVNVGQRGHRGVEVGESGSHVRRAARAAPILLQPPTSSSTQARL